MTFFKELRQLQISCLSVCSFLIGEDRRMEERYFNRTHFSSLLSEHGDIESIVSESHLTGRTSVQVKDFRRLRILTSERMFSSRFFSRFFLSTSKGDVASTGNVRIRLDVLSLKNFFVFFSSLSFHSVIYSSILSLKFACVHL